MGGGAGRTCRSRGEMELKVLSRIGMAVGLDFRMLLVHSSLILMNYDGNVN